MAKALKKQKKAPAPKVATSDSIWVQLGTPNELGEKILCATEGAARTKITNHVNSQNGFIGRHVREQAEVRKAIDDLVTEVASATINRDPKMFEVEIDPYTNMRLAAKVWRGAK